MKEKQRRKKGERKEKERRKKGERKEKERRKKKGSLLKIGRMKM
jgi:hypothetical protein